MHSASARSRRCRDKSPVAFGAAYAKQFVAPAKASKAVGLIKRSVQTGYELPLAEALAFERELLQQLFESEDAEEGLDAYTKKRQAQFKGK